MVDHAVVRKKYTQASVRARIEALFLDHLGEIVTRDQIQEAAKDQATGRVPENWHQRLSELRTDSGYTILTARDRSDLKVSEYLMLTAEKRSSANKRVRPTPAAWKAILVRAQDACEWAEGGDHCLLEDGAIDPVGGGTVKLTPDHRRPHSVHPATDPDDPTAWRALCGRHQVMKKNFWDDATGWLNVAAIIQAASAQQKREVLAFLLAYFRAEDVAALCSGTQRTALLAALKNFRTS